MKKSLLFRFASVSVTMKGGRIPFCVLFTALLPVVLGTFVCAPDGDRDLFDLGLNSTQAVIRSVFRSQAVLHAPLLIHTASMTDNIAVPVCLTKGADVWTVYDGGIRDEQAMRRLVWDRYPTADREGDPFADPLAFQPMDDAGYRFVSDLCDGIGYVWYNVDLAPGKDRHFRIWGDHWYLDAVGDEDGYFLTVHSDMLGRTKAQKVSDLIRSLTS